MPRVQSSTPWVRSASDGDSIRPIEYAISTPLKAPTASPVANAARMPISRLKPACIVVAMTMLQRQRTDPTERSMPPVMITNVMPSAMIAVNVKLRVML